VHATRTAHFRRELKSSTSVFGLIFGVSLGLGAAIALANPLLIVGVPAAIGLLLVASAWYQASTQAESEFFGALAPKLGLQYMTSGALPQLTPLLSAGDTQKYEHVMEGPIFGQLGGPRCMLAHYRYGVVKARSEEFTATTSYDFTVCAMEVPMAYSVIHGIFLRPRPQIRISGLWDDWLARARPEDVDLESGAFEERYELKVARDQERVALHELFSPSFIVWLAEHPLRPGFECKAGVLVVFVPGHEATPDRLTLFHEASREIARRVSAAVAAPRDAVTAS
jgi:hypothetical protein